MTEDVIGDAIDRCADGTADGQDRSIAAAALVRTAYAYAGLDALAFSRWLHDVADDIGRESPAGPLQ